MTTITHPPERVSAGPDAAGLRPAASGDVPVSCRNVTVTLGHGHTLVTALAGVDLDVHAGERVVLWGRSGSGKSTLLHTLGGLLAPTSGHVLWHGRPLRTIDGQTHGRLREPGIANVFQSPNLLPYFTAFENVAFAARAADEATPGPAGSPLDLLRLVGLDGKADALPAELSGGEAQRVAIARALAQRTELLLCDEPTGHLDSDTGSRVLALIEALQRELGFALIVATHDPDVAARFPREVELLDGRVVRDEVIA
jgi:ABC-type lipoprotein export system ATPase subunit